MLTLTADGVPVAAKVVLDESGQALVLTPLEPLAYGTTYTARLAGGVKLTEGDWETEEITWSFTTAAPPGQVPEEPQEPEEPAGPQPIRIPTSYGYLIITPAMTGPGSLEAVLDAGALAGQTGDVVVDLKVTEYRVPDDPQRKVTVSDRSVLLPQPALWELVLSGRRVVIVTDAGRLEVPADALVTHQQVIARGSSGMVRIALTKANLGVMLTATVEGVWAPAPLTDFVTPVRLTLPYQTAVVPEHLGIYRFDRETGQLSYAGGRVDRETRTVTAELLQSGQYVVREYLERFSDLPPTHWAYADVQLMAARHIAKGTAPGVFSPDAQVTRAQIAALLVRALGLKPERQITLRMFEDVPPTAWYRAEVETAAMAGLVKGDQGLFRPDDPVTRQELAVMLVRALTRARPDLVPEADVAKLAERYTDAGAIAPWAAESAAVAAELGLVTGLTAETWNPGDTATRAEAAVMLARLLRLIDP